VISRVHYLRICYSTVSVALVKFCSIHNYRYVNPVKLLASPMAQCVVRGLVILMTATVCKRESGHLVRSLLGSATSVEWTGSVEIALARKQGLTVPRGHHSSPPRRAPLAASASTEGCCYRLRLYRGTGPAYFKHVCTPVSDISGRAHLRYAERRDMLVPRTRTELGRRSLPVAAPTVWNSLPAHLRSTLISRRQFRDG